MIAKHCESLGIAKVKAVPLNKKTNIKFYKFSGIQHMSSNMSPKLKSSRCFKMVRVNISFLMLTKVRRRKLISTCKLKRVVLFPFSMTLL